MRISPQCWKCFARRTDGAPAAEPVDDHRGTTMSDIPPLHPGRILFEEFLKPLGISQYRLAKDIGVPAMRINKICHGHNGISADSALRLARYFGTSVEFWTGMQAHYDTERAKMELGDRLEKEVKLRQPVARHPD